MRMLALIFAAMALLSLGPILIHTYTTEPDLFERLLLPEMHLRDPLIIDWPSLARVQADSCVRMLGYMMDDEPPISEGASVSAFVLMSETGSLVHPAHRIPEEMIAVRLRAGTVTTFQSRRLVWVRGTLSSCYVSERGEEPRYCLTDAEISGAERGDITRFFSNP